MVEGPNSVGSTSSLVALAKQYELESTQATDISIKILLLKKAATSHHGLGDYSEEARLLMMVANLLEGDERVDCLARVWNSCMMAITAYKYEASYEWKGEVENLDPSYGETVEGYYLRAVDALEEALKTRGVNKELLYRRLYEDCIRRRNDGGWGESECFESIDESFKGIRINGSSGESK